MTHNLYSEEIVDIFRALGEIEGTLRLVEHLVGQMPADEQQRFTYTRSLQLLGNVTEKLKIEYCHETRSEGAEPTVDEGLNSNFRRALET